jgi:hypothetical protein
MQSTSSDSLSTEALIRNATQPTNHILSHSSSSLSTDALIHIASQPPTTHTDLLLHTTPNSLLDLDPSTPEDVSLSDDDQQVQKATKHLQLVSLLLSAQTPSSSSSSSSSSDDDFHQIDIHPTLPIPQSPHLPLNQDPPVALPTKLGK